MALLQTRGIPSACARRRAGRPKAVVDPTLRRKRIRLAYLVLKGHLLVKEAAIIAGVHRQTFWRRVTELLEDGQPDTDHLRELADRP